MAVNQPAFDEYARDIGQRALARFEKSLAAKRFVAAYDGLSDQWCFFKDHGQPLKPAFVRVDAEELPEQLRSLNEFKTPYCGPRPEGDPDWKRYIKWP